MDRRGRALGIVVLVLFARASAEGPTAAPGSNGTPATSAPVGIGTRSEATLGTIVSADVPASSGSVQPPSLTAAVRTATETATAPAPGGYKPGAGLTVSMLNGQSTLKLIGQFSTIGVFATDRPLAAGMPLLLLPPSPFGNNTNTFDLHARQSSVGAIFSGPEVAGWKPGATFLGFIQNDNLLADGYGFLPYQAYADLRNDDWRIAGGLQSDVFNPGKPTLITLASLFGSGNTGSFRGQFRVERFLKPSDEAEFTIQTALSEPVSTIVSDNTRLLEDNGWPNVELRLAAGLGAAADRCGGRKTRPMQVGVSGMVGQLRTSRLITAPTDPDDPNRVTVDIWGLGLDFDLALGDRFGVSGELFLGAGLGEYNGGVQQSFNSATFQTIRSRGGFVETYWYLSDRFHLHVGYGLDSPTLGDLAPTQFARNRTAYVNAVYDASKSLQFMLEVDHRRTDYLAFADAEGVVIMTQMLIKF